MNHRTAKAATAMTCALSLLAACGETTAGTPTSANGDTTTTATKSSSPKPSSERPRDITLDGKDPCGLTPQSDWAKFELDKPGKSKENQTFNVPECFYSSSMGGFSILLNTTEGIEAWDESHRDVRIKEVEPIRGYKALQLDQKSPPGTCSVVVDVATGQTLDSVVNVRSEQIDNKCKIAYEFAESAMKTLVGGN